ncbi:MAG TPA: hypothetical protein DG757_11455 [Bacillus sp. (in: Bacteria)]|nr:hypothetical protein [Bacillus sp. (in: firmicutes)]
MNFGKIIKYHRRIQNLTQAELSEGICSVSHLSKIENKNTEVDNEIILLLLKKLTLSLDDIVLIDKKIFDELNEFINAILFYDLKTAGTINKSLIEKEELISQTEYIYLYHLYQYRYYLFSNDIEQAIVKKKFLAQFLKVLSPFELDLYRYFNALFLLQTEQYDEALASIKLVEKENSLSLNFLGDLNYHIALIHSIIKNNSFAIMYGHKALVEYTREYNFIRTLHAQILLSINYSELGLYEDALELYKPLLRNTLLTGQTSLLSTIHHNLAYLYEKKGELSKAIIHYELSLNNNQKNDMYYKTLYNLTEVLYRQGKKKEALIKIKDLLKYTDNKNHRIYFLQSKYLYYLLNENQPKAIDFLEKTMIPYLEQNNDKEGYYKYLLHLVDFYKDRDSKKAFYYCELLHNKGE